MTTKNVLTATCPSCRTVLQVKTRSAEKTVPCPKCQTPVTVAEALPEAAFWEEPQQPAAVEPGATLAAARATTGLPGPMAITIGASAAIVMFGVGIFFAVRAGNGGLVQPVPVVNNDKPKQPSDKGGGGPAIDPKPGVQPDLPFVPATDGGKGAKNNPAPQDQGSAAKQAAKLQMDQAYQVFLGAESAWRQRRDWRLANEGRERARGMPLIPEQLEPAKQRLDQARINYDAARRVYQQFQ